MKKNKEPMYDNDDTHVHVLNHTCFKQFFEFEK